MSGPVWLVDGDDPTLVAQALAEVVGQALGQADRTFALEEVEAEGADLSAVAEACRTPPFLTDRRVVVVRGIGEIGADAAAPLVAYLDDPLDSTTLVLGAVGGRVPAKLLTAVKAKGEIRHTALRGRQTEEYVTRRLAEAPVRLDHEAAAALAAHLGEDVSRLPALLETLASVYGRGARLGAADLVDYLGQAGGVAPWDLTDAIDAGRTEDALVLLHRLLDGGDRHPLVVHATLARHVGSMLAVDGPDIRSEAQAAQAMGIAAGASTYPAKKALKAAQAMGSERVGEAVTLAAAAELALKGAPSSQGAQEWPPELVLEVLVARLCRLAKVSRNRPAGGAGRSRPAVSSRTGS
ncbi:MAG: DNA polymerase III subunit delta [Acidimicrobiales bacterium]